MKNNNPLHNILHRHSLPRKRSLGLTLIENMIALLVLSIGLLGLAGLQTSSLRNGKDANTRAIATQQAADMVNRILINTGGVSTGEYNNVTSTPTAPTVFCNVTKCTTAELAIYDAWEWNTKNAAALPGGQGTVTSTALNMSTPNPLLAPLQFTVTVRWDADRTNPIGLGCNPKDADDLKCVTLQVVAP